MNINIYKVTVSAAYIFKLFLSYIFLDKEIAKKKVQPAGGSGLFFVSPSQWIGNKQLFKVGLIEL